MENIYYLLWIPCLFFFLLGWTIWVIFWIGVYRNPKQSLIAFDQWLAVVFLNDSYADETISAWAHRKHHKRIERFINWMFKESNHCAHAYISEMRGAQNAPEYRQ